VSTTSTGDDAPAEVVPRLGASYHKVFAASVISNLGDGIGLVAYPWLASAVTRNPLLISLVAVANRLPWLVFTLPAGVITDRVDRRSAIVVMDGLRCALTLLVALAVLARQDALPGPDEVDTTAGCGAQRASRTRSRGLRSGRCSSQPCSRCRSSSTRCRSSSHLRWSR
jgi:hypothetical protein